MSELEQAIARLEEISRNPAVQFEADLRTVIEAAKRPPLTDAAREQIEQTVRSGIGYDPVPLSIRDHPEIRSEYRTAEDADGLVKRITDAILTEFRPVASTRERLVEAIAAWRAPERTHGDIQWLSARSIESIAARLYLSGAVEDRAEVEAKVIEAAADDLPSEVTLFSRGYDGPESWLRARAASIREGRS